jgi:hypothetical protein
MHLSAPFKQITMLFHTSWSKIAFSISLKSGWTFIPYISTFLPKLPLAQRNTLMLYLHCLWVLQKCNERNFGINISCYFLLLENFLLIDENLLKFFSMKSIQDNHFLFCINSSPIALNFATTSSTMVLSKTNHYVSCFRYMTFGADHHFKNMRPSTIHQEVLCCPSLIVISNSTHPNHLYSTLFSFIFFQICICLTSSFRYFTKMVAWILSHVLLSDHTYW